MADQGANALLETLYETIGKLSRLNLHATIVQNSVILLPNTPYDDDPEKRKFIVPTTGLSALTDLSNVKSADVILDINGTQHLAHRAYLRRCPYFNAQENFASTSDSENQPIVKLDLPGLKK
ncbi:hypothetical protein HDV00_000616 [Rhizophlyctis rosea]|nr:hypothetical protein HDV00_000616 [Rhizophlyctis rosea]